MKTTFLKTMIVCFTLVFASCSNDDAVAVQTPTPTPVPTDKTTFKLDDVLITADETTATDYIGVVSGIRQIDVSVKKGGIEILELHMPASTGVCPANQTGSVTTSWLTYEANGGANFPNDYYHSTSGSMNLTTVDLVGNRLRGTFNFIGNNTLSNKTITEGNLVVNTMIHQ